MSYQVIDPFLEFTNPANGQPIGIGSVYFGRPDSDPKNQPSNRINVYAVQDNGSEVLLSQPITLNAAGQPQYNGSPKQLKIELAGSDTSYCVQVFDKNGAQKLYTARVDPTVSVAGLAVSNSAVSIAGVSASNVARRYNEFLFVKDFGVVGDGIADDTAALQAAFLAASGKTLIFDYGTYKTTGTINISAHSTKIEGRGATITYFGSSNAIGFSLVGGTVYPVECSIKQLNIIVNSGVSASAIIFRCSYSQFEEVSVSLKTAAASAKGFVLVGDEVNGTGSYYNMFLRCVVQSQSLGVDHTGLLFVATPPLYRAPNANTFVGGRFGQCLRGIVVKGNGNTFINPAIENASLTGTAFTFEADTAVNCQGNNVFGAYIENASTGILLTTSASYNTFYSTFQTGVGTPISDLGSNNIYVDALSAARLPNGIKLGSTATAQTALNYYKEGSWAPSLRGGVSAGSYTLAVTGAKYTRIGNIVYVCASMSVTVNSAGTGDAVFDGLPFNRLVNTTMTSSVNMRNVTIAAGVSDVAIAPVSTFISDDKFVIYGTKSGLPQVYTQCSDIITGSVIEVNFSYMAA